MGLARRSVGRIKCLLPLPLPRCGGRTLLSQPKKSTLGKRWEKVERARFSDTRWTQGAKLREGRFLPRRRRRQLIKVAKGHTPPLTSARKSLSDWFNNSAKKLRKKGVSLPKKNKKGILSLICGVEYSIFDKSNEPLCAQFLPFYTNLRQGFRLSHPS